MNGRRLRILHLTAGSDAGGLSRYIHDLSMAMTARGHAIAYYPPDRLAQHQGVVFATVRPLTVRDREGDHFALGEPRRVRMRSSCWAFVTT